MSIKTKIVLAKLITTLLTVLLVGSFGYHLLLNFLVEVQREKLEFIALSSAREVDRMLRNLEGVLEGVEAPSILPGHGPAAQHLARIQETFPVLRFLDHNGDEEFTLVRGRVAEEPRNWKETELFRQSLSNPYRIVRAPVSESPELGEPVLRLALTRFPSPGESEQTRTVIAAAPLSVVMGILGETAVGKTGSVTLLDASGLVLSAGNGGSDLNSPPAAGNSPLRQIVQSRQAGFVRDTFLGADRFIAFAPLQSADLGIAADLPHREFMEAPNRFLVTSLCAVTLILSAGLIFFYFFARRMTGAIGQLIRHTEHVSKGDFTRTIAISSGDELEVLAHSLNSMTEGLRRAVSAKESLHNILHSIIDPLVVTGGDGRIVGLNPSAEKFFGSPQGLLIGVPLADLFPEGEPLFRGQGFQRVLESGPIRNYETQVLAGGEKMVPVLFSCSLNSPDEDGSTGIVGIIKDISDRREAEIARLRALRESEEARDKIDAILKSVADALLVTDIEGRIILMNPPAEELLGIDLLDAWQQPISTVIKEKTLREHLLQQAPGDAPCGVDLQIYHQQRQEMRVFQARTSPVENREHLITGHITTLRDATHERQVDRLKNEFISTAAHELRTPLTSIMGYSEFLMYPEEFGGFDAEQQREFLAEIFEKAEVLSKIVNELLDISRIESGQSMPLAYTRFGAEETISRIVRDFRLHSPTHRFELDLCDPPTEVWVDQGKFVQILENLLSNAVKYSPTGTPVRIISHRVGDRVRISVKDQGIGMTEEQVARIFDKFYRADSSNTAIGGLGLGMSIVKTIVSAHGGTIWVESAPALGTTVTFTLPIGSEIPFVKEEDVEYTHAEEEYTSPFSLRA